MRRRDAARKAYRSHPSPARRNAFCSLRNEVKLQTDNAKNKYLLNRLGAITNSARLWSELRSLGLANPKSSNSHPEIFLNQLNTFFTTAHLSSPSTPPVLAYPPSCPSSPSSSASPVVIPHPSAPLQIPDTPTSIPRHPVSLSPPNPSIADSSTFYFLHITPDVLRKALSNCSFNSTGPDNINRRLIMDSPPPSPFPSSPTSLIP